MIRAPTGRGFPYPRSRRKQWRLFWRQDRPLPPLWGSRESRQERSFLWHFSILRLVFFRPLLSRWARASAFGALSICLRATATTIPVPMLMYGKEASNRKQEINRQHHTIPNQRPKDKHYGNVHSQLYTFPRMPTMALL